MSYLIDTDKLQFGDIIMVRKNDRTCQLIRRESRSSYSHALIYRDGKIALESEAFGVNSLNLQRLLLQGPDDACAYRIKDKRLIPKLQVGLSNVASKIGTGYAKRHEVEKSRTDTTENANQPNRQFCTRFAAQVYAESGLPIAANHDYCSTLDIEQSTALVAIPNILRLASPAEIELANDKDNANNRQTDATYNYLESIRNLTGEDLQTFDQVEEFLVSKPSYNDDFERLMDVSGYLKLGDLEREMNAIQYNTETFLNHCGLEECLSTAEREHPLERGRIYNYKMAILKYRDLYGQTGCSFFKAHMECFERQLEYAKERTAIFQEIFKIAKDFDDMSFLDD